MKEENLFIWLKILVYSVALFILCIPVIFMQIFGIKIDDFDYAEYRGIGDYDGNLENTPFWVFLTCIYLLFFCFFLMWYYPLYYEEKHETGEDNE